MNTRVWQSIIRSPALCFLEAPALGLLRDQVGKDPLKYQVLPGTEFLAD